MSEPWEVTEAKAIESMCRAYPALTPTTARQEDISILNHMWIIERVMPREQRAAAAPYLGVE